MGNGKAFVWTPQKRQALDLCTEWGVSQWEIAEQVGVTLHTIEGWVRRPAFRAELDARYAAIRASNEAHWARERAELEQKRREAEQRAAELLPLAQAEAREWVAWKMACHRARAAHRKLPPEPPEPF